jgi:hypothetical protein
MQGVFCCLRSCSFSLFFFRGDEGKVRIESHITPGTTWKKTHFGIVHLVFLSYKLM